MCEFVMCTGSLSPEEQIVHCLDLYVTFRPSTKVPARLWSL